MADSKVASLRPIPDAEHERKYEEIAQLCGIATLVYMVARAIEPARIKEALDAGDQSLNTIPLHRWDALAFGISSVHDKEWPYRDLQKTANDHPWRRRMSWSLCERVCVLKHVAKFHVPFPEIRLCPACGVDTMKCRCGFPF